MKNSLRNCIAAAILLLLASISFSSDNRPETEENVLSDNMIEAKGNMVTEKMPPDTVGNIIIDMDILVDTMQFHPDLVFESGSESKTQLPLVHKTTLYTNSKGKLALKVHYVICPKDNGELKILYKGEQPFFTASRTSYTYDKIRVVRPEYLELGNDIRFDIYTMARSSSN